TPANPAVTVDAATAERVFQSLFPLRSRAVFFQDADSIALIETGAAREYDLARCHLGCPTPPVSGGGVRHTFSAPRQSAYPAFFIARADRYGVAGQAVSEVIVFTRQSRAAPWLVALDDSTEGANPLLDDDNLGLDAAVPRLRGPNPSSLTGAFAAYLQHWWDAGSDLAGTPFETAGLRERTAAIWAGHDKLDANREREVKRYSADPSAGVFVVRAYGNQVLTCGVVRHASTYTPAPGAPPLVQGPDRSDWGESLAPGSYQAIDEAGLEEDCFLVAPDGHASPFYTEPLTPSASGTASAT